MITAEDLLWEVVRAVVADMNLDRPESLWQAAVVVVPLASTTVVAVVPLLLALVDLRYLLLMWYLVRVPLADSELVGVARGYPQLRIPEVKPYR